MCLKGPLTGCVHNWGRLCLVFHRRFKRTVSRDRICQSLLALNLIIFGVIASMLGFEWPAFRHAAGVR